MKKILIVVDYQYDFVDPNGALPVPNADTISQNIQNRIDSDEYSNVIYTFDTHTPEQYNGSAEQELFPNIHCEFRTVGWNFYKIKPNYDVEFQKKVSNNSEPFEMIRIQNEFFFTKNVFNIWEGNKTYPKWFVETFPKDEYEIDVVGVATEFCVKMNIIGTLERGYKVNLIQNAIAAITSEGENEALDIFTKHGVNFK